jgi:hypothetical protein
MRRLLLIRLTIGSAAAIVPIVGVRTALRLRA